MSGVTCHISYITCKVSHVNCQLSGVRCPVQPFTYHMSLTPTATVGCVGFFLGETTNGAHVLSCPVDLPLTAEELFGLALLLVLHWFGTALHNTLHTVFTLHTALLTMLNTTLLTVLPSALNTTLYTALNTAQHTEG